MARHGWEQTERRGRGLAEEANAAVRSGRPLAPAWLDSAAGWLAEVAPVWPDLTDGVPAGRQYRLIASSPHLEAWLICWPSAGRLELHDHGGAGGALRVLGGSLTEQFVADRSHPARRRRLEAGQGISFDADYVHDVVNLDAEMATSVHVYSSPGRPMGYYRLSEAGMLMVPGRIDDVAGTGPGDAGLSLASVR
ncbi:MAG: cysteine dioxygenase family protein [Actinomycetota bacterium]|nr:cysteine dioxygenase family protein [Actinomycetota bacterium]